MKYSTTLLLAASGLVLAQDLSAILNSLPKCAVSCFTEAAGATGCGLTDMVCQCTTGREAAQKALIPCICKGCQTDDVTNAIEAGEKICKDALAAAKQSYNSTATTQGNVCQALASSQTGGAASSSAPAAGPASSASTAPTAAAYSPAASAQTGATGAAPAPYGTGNTTTSSGSAQPSSGNNPPSSGTGSGNSSSTGVEASKGSASRIAFSGAVVGLAALVALAF